MVLEMSPWQMLQMHKDSCHTIHFNTRIIYNKEI